VGVRGRVIVLSRVVHDAALKAGTCWQMKHLAPCTSTHSRRGSQQLKQLRVLQGIGGRQAVRCCANRPLWVQSGSQRLALAACTNRANPSCMLALNPFTPYVMQHPELYCGAQR
jgi:hypothetical protein